MKKTLFIITLLASFVITESANAQFSDLLKKANITKGGGSENQAADGIKEALGKGVTKAVLQLNKQDGFFKDATYKILLPPEAEKIEKTLRRFGADAMVDKAILQINRGAEDAMVAATPIFTNAIKEMTITDAMNLVKGGDNSATNYFKEKTSASLTTTFLPIIKASLDKTEGTKYYSDIVNRYNTLPLTMQKMNPDLANYVTEKAIKALFDLIGKEEKNIRSNPLARTSELLKSVFGGLFK